MGFLRWIGGIVAILWLLGLVFRIGGGMVHAFIVVAVVIFLFDFVFGRERT